MVLDFLFLKGLFFCLMDECTLGIVDVNNIYKINMYAPSIN